MATIKSISVHEIISKIIKEYSKNPVRMGGRLVRKQMRKQTHSSHDTCRLVRYNLDRYKLSFQILLPT